MSGLFGSVTIKGQRVTDFGQTGASVGNAIPFGFGTYLTNGNVIWAPLPPREIVKKKKQGKGGVKTETYYYILSYAIAFCKGPIQGFLTIRRNGKVVYTTDPNASVSDQAYSAKWAQKATFYYGTEEQLPDSTIESYQGSGKVSAFRGLAYIVIEDDDVTDTSGAVPNYDAVVIASPLEGYFTSHGYNVDTQEDNSMGFNTAEILSFDLKTALHVYEIPQESFEIGANIQSIDLKEYDIKTIYETLEIGANVQSFDLALPISDEALIRMSVDVQSFTLGLPTMDEALIQMSADIQSFNLGP